MVFLTEENVIQLSKNELEKEALKYSNLCKANMEVIRVLEEQVKRLAGELGASHQLVLFTQVQLNQLKSKTFGTSSEKRKEVADLPLFSQSSESTQTEKVSYERKKRTQFGRTSQPGIPRQEVLHLYGQDDLKKHGLTPWKDQFEISELITITPTQFVIQEHKRQKYHGKPKQLGAPAPIITAPGPLKLKEGSRYSVEFGVHVGIEKYDFHQPLDRQVRWMKSHGLICTSQVLFAQIDSISWYLENSFIPRLKEEILKQRVHIADESYWQNLGKQDQNKRFWIWAVKSGRGVFFEIYDSRSKAVALQFLKGLEGVLLTDGYPVYRSMASPQLKLSNDWCHLRRKVIAAEKTHPEESKFLLEQIRALFLIEREIKLLTPEERRQVRKEKSKSYVQIIQDKLEEYEKVLPKSPLGRVVEYAKKLWAGLILFLDDPDVPLHSNEIEQVLRPPVLGRNNHHGSHSLATAKVAAIWYSVIATCRENQVDPREYLEKILYLILEKKPFPMPWDFKSDTQKATPAPLEPAQLLHLQSHK
jgi:transposase